MGVISIHAGTSAIVSCRRMSAVELICCVWLYDIYLGMWATHFELGSVAGKVE